ncbi:MAG: rhodanese [Rhodopirellula sp.]|nr:rhodanese [Rhodopirellula sp.]
MLATKLALVCNGTILFASALLALICHPAFVWLVVFMAASLMFSGWTGYCGFAVIFRYFGRK